MGVSGRKLKWVVVGPLRERVRGRFLLLLAGTIGTLSKSLRVKRVKEARETRDHALMW